MSPHYEIIHFHSLLVLVKHFHKWIHILKEKATENNKRNMRQREMKWQKLNSKAKQAKEKENLEWGTKQKMSEWATLIRMKSQINC